MSTRNFQLTKWYFDVLDSSGRGMIGYQADLAWGKVKLGYEGVIPVGKVGFRSSGNFNSRSSVTETKDQVNWTSKISNGTWRRRSSQVSIKLLDSELGFVFWQCVQPSAEAAVTIGSIEVSGWGYAEKMTLTLPPWRLPIKELLWGRFVSENHSLVWIRWSGPVPRLILCHNGKQIDNPGIEKERISFHDFVLELPTEVIRKGTLGDSLFSGSGKLAALFPRSILGLYEEKWHGTAMLKQGAHELEVGNVIHESVLWP